MTKCYLPVNAENYRGYRWFGEVLKIKPDGQGEYHEKGLSMAKLGRYDDALISYNTAIKIKVDYCEAFSTKKLSVAETERHHSAKNCYHKVIEIKADDISVWNNKMSIMNVEKDYD